MLGAILSIVLLSGYGLQPDVKTPGRLNITRTVVSSESVSTSTVNDLVLRLDYDASFYEDVAPVHPSAKIKRLSGSPAIVDPVGLNYRSTGTGTARFKVTVGRVAYFSETDVFFGASVCETTLVDFVAGSMGRHCDGNVNNLINGKSPSATVKNVFLVQNAATDTFTRNPELWCKDYVQDLTGHSPWNSKRGRMGAGILITPQHAIFATHWNPPISVGNTVKFVGIDNAVFTRTVTAIYDTGLNDNQAWPMGSDISLALLDSPLPTNITPCLIAPEGLFGAGGKISILKERTYNQRGVRVVSLDQWERASIHEVSSQHDFSIYARRPDSIDADWSRTLISGDSGNGQSLMVSNRLALLQIFTGVGGGGGEGNYLGDFVDLINRSIVSIDTIAGHQTGYTCSVVDVSGFPSY